MKLLNVIGKVIKNPRLYLDHLVFGVLFKNQIWLRYYRPTSKNEKEYAKKVSRYRVEWNKQNTKLVLMQVVEDFVFGVKISATANRLAIKHGANIGTFNSESRIERRNMPTNRLWNKYLAHKFLEYWDKVFLAVGGKLIFRNSDLFPDQKKVELVYNDILSQIKTKQDVLKIKIDGIVIGDLIYDSYLRFANKPTINLNDPFLNEIIWQAVNMYYVSESTLMKNNVVALVSSYATYTKHGIMVRLCLSKNIPVYLPLCGYLSIIHQAHQSYPSHINNHFNYKRIFSQLGNKDEILTKYAALFEKRFEGIIDGATYYMKESAFSSKINNELQALNWNKTVVVLAHCFFDSPHVYRELIFTDFYEWLIFTLDELIQKKELTVLVKPHPNGLPGNDAIFEALAKKYANTNVKFIDKKTSQLQIINSQPLAMLTIHGTAAAEFAYHNIPVLSIYDNPFATYSFTKCSHSKEEYKKAIAEIETIKMSISKKEIIEYYYMHNFYFLNGRNSDYMDLFKFGSDSISNDFLIKLLPDLTDDFFVKLDQFISEGFNIVDLENNICNLT